MKGQTVVMSKGNDEWSTPAHVYQALHKRFKFNLDPCATAENAKCSKFFTEAEDGLKQSWATQRVFINPPYSQVKHWVKKSYEEARQHAATVVLLIPARTCTSWFHDYVTKANEIYFIRGRLKFGAAENSAPFPSMVVVFEPNLPLWEVPIRTLDFRSKGK